ncbi:hypothetical protein K3495_g1900 [Podosphaera aphanis]|nr:hypothetical protein K3495_g1900 [Podosphaera aphanis]
MIRYDVDTRWNSTYRMLADAVSSRAQISAFLFVLVDLFSLAEEDKSEVNLIVELLGRMQSYTDEVSKRESKINLAIPIYFELHDYLDELVTGSGKYQDVPSSLRSAFLKGQKKFKKYFLEADSIDAFDRSTMLDPRLKG